MHWGRKYRYQSFLKKGVGITLVLGAAFAALESDGLAAHFSLFILGIFMNPGWPR